tara:strand:+ start:173 stop:562 length:390 start_codon:yes stop_codon:yes gene_type:complete
MKKSDSDSDISIIYAETIESEEATVNLNRERAIYRTRSISISSCSSYNSTDDSKILRTQSIDEYNECKYESYIDENNIQKRREREKNIRNDRRSTPTPANILKLLKENSTKLETLQKMVEEKEFQREKK